MVGHDEYWTPTMVANVKHARDEGVNLLFLCGNSVDGAVYWIILDGRPTASQENYLNVRLAMKKN